MNRPSHTTNPMGTQGHSESCILTAMPCTNSLHCCRACGLTHAGGAGGDTVAAHRPQLPPPPRPPPCRPRAGRARAASSLRGEPAPGNPQPVQKASGSQTEKSGQPAALAWRRLEARPGSRALASGAWGGAPCSQQGAQAPREGTEVSRQQPTPAGPAHE